jgi:hypothetical protein
VNLNINDKDADKKTTPSDINPKPISLYDSDFKDEHPKAGESGDIFEGLPSLTRPKLLQTPYEIPQLFPFNRTCVYLLMAPESSHLKPTSVVLKRHVTPRSPRA